MPPGRSQGHRAPEWIPLEFPPGRTTLGEAADRYARESPRGEFVLVVRGAAHVQRQATLEDGAARVEELRAAGCSLRDAARQAAAELGLSRKQLYDQAVDGQEK